MPLQYIVSMLLCNQKTLQCKHSPFLNDKCVFEWTINTSMLTGAGVRGCKYSGCSKCPVCAVNILITRMGSRFACRRGSRGVNKETTAPGRDFALSLVSLSSIRLLTDPEGRYFIGERALRFLCVRLLLVPNNVTIQVMFKCNPCRHVPKQTNRKTKHSCTSLNVPKDGESSQIV